MATTLYYANQYFTTTLSVTGGIDASQTTSIVLQSVSGIETSKPGIICMEWADPLGTNREWITYTSINSTTKTLVGAGRGGEGDAGTGKAHSNGVAVAFPVSESHINNLVAGLSIDGVATNGIEGVLDEDDMASDSNTKLATQQSIKAYVDNNSGSDGSTNLYQQALINGNFDIWQRGTTFNSTTTPLNSDDTYLMDRWVLLSDGNDIVDVSRSTDSPDGSKYSAKFQVETANKKFGIVQIIENVDAMKLDNKTVSVSFQAKTTTGKLIENLRVAVLSWNSTADTVTSDVVSAWAAEGTNPTWATNWTAENTATNKAITTSWAEYKVEGIDIDTASMANIAVVIWVDDTDASVDDELFLSQIQLCEGSTALPFQPKSYAQELRDCQRYYWKSITPDNAIHARGSAINTTTVTLSMALPVIMRTTPSIDKKTLYIADGANTNLNVTPSVDNYNNGIINLSVGGLSVTQFRPYYLCNQGNDQYLAFKAEL